MKKIYNKKTLKSLLSIMISILMIFGMFACVCSASVYADTNIWDGTVATGFGGGNGNWDNPFIISNASELAFFTAVLNTTGTGTAYNGKNFKLTADIYLNDLTNFDNWGTTAPTNKWASLGRYINGTNYRDFGGTFDGNNHTIYGLYTDGTNNGGASGTASSGTGLFGAVNNATIKNLFIDKAYVSGTTIVGGFVGYVRGNTTFTNCSFNGTVTGTQNQIGGFIGKYDGSSTTLYINSCCVKGHVKGIESGSALAGGFIGFQAGTSTTVNVNNSYVAAKVSGHDTIGGIVGRLDNGSNNRVLNVRKSHLYGAVQYSGNATYAYNCGSVAGQYSSNSVINADSFYYFSTQYTNSDSLIDKRNGIKKTQTEFKDGTVVDLLNAVEVDSTTDKFTWKQSQNYPTFNNISGDVLTNLVDSEGKIAFATATKTYNIAVTSTTNSITLTPTYSGRGCYVTINDVVVSSGVASSAINLAEENNTISVKVYEEDGLLTQYTVNVYRRKAIDVGTVWSGNADTEFESGSGLWNDPYIIASAEQLALLANNVNSANGDYYSGRYFKLVSDIYLNNNIADYDTWSTTAPTNSWSPIGNGTGKFSGIFDGDGHTIYGMYVNGGDTGTNGYGLFGFVGYNGTVKNVNVRNSYVYGKLSIGGVVGTMNGSGTQTVENCSFDGILEAASANSYTGAGGYLGGIVGLANGSTNKIVGCYSSGTVYSQRYSGGIIGHVKSSSILLDNCYSTMTFNTKVNNLDPSSSLGGILGKNESATSVTITNSFFNGAFEVDKYNSIIGHQAKNGAAISVQNVFYNNALNSSDYGVSKSSAQFADGTVARLLIEACGNDAVWSWCQGDTNPEKANILPGDVNNDLDINIIDLVVLKKYFANSNNVIVVKDNADIYTDLKIDASDLSYLIKTLLESNDSYMINCVSKAGTQNGQFGQEVMLDSAKTYVFSFNYSMNISGGLRPLVATYNNEGSQINISTKSILDSRSSTETFEFSVPDTAKVTDGKAKVKVGIKYDILSSGSFANFTLVEKNTTTNLLNNSNFANGLSGWMDASYTTISNNKLIGSKHEVVVVPKLASLFVEKVPELNDDNYNDGNWASSIEAPTITGNSTDWVGTASNALMTKTGGADSPAATLKSNIINTANSAYTISGTTYSISKDNKTFNPSDYTLKSGDAVLFERGGVYRINGSFNIPSGVTIGAYGSGDKPIITGSAMNYAKAPWTPSNKRNVWKLDIGTTDAGIIVFNHGELAGTKYFCINDLESEGDFFHNNTTGALYLYCESNYPSAKYDDIEIGVRDNLLFVDLNASNVTIDNLCIKYVGAHAIGTQGKNSNITVTNCELGWIGGSTWDITDEQNPELRYGNAIQFWNSVTGATVTNNYIYQVYDAGLTYQGDADETYADIDFSNNLIEYCTYNIELLCGADTICSNISIEDNILRFAGFGWGNQRPDEIRGAQICIGSTLPTSTTNSSITNNICDTSNLWTIFCNSSSNTYSGLPIFGNTYYQSANKYDFAVWFLKSNIYYATNQAEYVTAIDAVDNNATVNWIS